MSVRARLSLMLLAVTLVFAGCASTSTKTSASAAPADGLMCPACGSVWLRDPAHSQGGSLFRSAGAKGCAECEKMAAMYFASGATALHKCSICGATPSVVMPRDHAPRPGY